MDKKLGELKIESGMEKVGRELSKKCPNDECRLYSALYSRYSALRNDRKKYAGQLSAASASAIEKEMRRTAGELYDMYFFSRAVRRFAAEHK